MAKAYDAALQKGVEKKDGVTLDNAATPNEKLVSYDEVVTPPPPYDHIPLGEQRPNDGDMQPLTELDQINRIERMATNFIFLFGGQQRGKTVVTSSMINFMADAQMSGGQLSPFDVRRGGLDHGNALYRKILRLFAERIFPGRTVLVGNEDPIYLNVKFTPTNLRDKQELFLTFLEMPGDSLQRIDAPDGGRGDFPTGIDVFFRAQGTSMSFILITEHTRAAEDDQLLSSFIDYVTKENRGFENSRFLLLVSKWDDYDGGLGLEEFVKRNMRLTYSKLYDKKHSMHEFSIGNVGVADNKPFLREFNPIPAKVVLNWVYTNVYHKPLYRKGFWARLRSMFLKYS